MSGARGMALGAFAVIQSPLKEPRLKKRLGAHKNTLSPKALNWTRCKL